MMYFNIFENYTVATIILLSSLFAAYAYYFLTTEIFKVKKSKIFLITVGVYFVLFFLAYDYTIISFYGRSGAFFNIFRSICQMIPKAGLVFLFAKGFQLLFNLIKPTPKTGGEISTEPPPPTVE